MAKNDKTTRKLHITALIYEERDDSFDTLFLIEAFVLPSVL